MADKTDSFAVDKDLDLRDLTAKDVVDKTLNGLDSVTEGNYMLISINDYSHVAEIAKAVVTRKAAVDSVLKKNKNEWVVMIKNDVPVAQPDRA